MVGHTLARYVDMATERVALPVKLPFDFKSIQRINITACGTASYAGFVAKYWFERFARLPVEVDVASEFRYREAPLRKGDLAIFISQSGETADTLAALRYAKAEGAQIPVRADVAMTGEVTLRGRVLPVGGVREKALAALRRGLRKLIIPEANRHDLDELPPELARQLEFSFVHSMDEVLELALTELPGTVHKPAPRSAPRATPPLVRS